MKNRVLTNCTAFLLAILMCVQTAVNVHAVSAKPSDTATEENVLAVLRQYDADAYHIMTAGTGISFITWFMGGSIISGIDTAVHETYHGYTHSQSNIFYGERIYLRSGKSYDVDYSIVYKGSNFTKTEEMSRQIPSKLQTMRYNTYVAPGTSPDANTKGVFGLLNEFTAYYWGLETMNSLAQFLMDTNAEKDAWSEYISSIGNNMTAYAEFKYWTLRYMLYIKSANPSLYQAILDNQNYCAAYRDADAAFASEIARSKEIVDGSADYMRSKGFSVEWSDSGIYLTTGSSNSGGNGNFNFWGNVDFNSWGDDDFDSWYEDFFNSLGSGYSGSLWNSYSRSGLSLENYNALMAELRTAEYIEIDSILKNAGSAPATPPATSTTSPATSFSPHASLSPQKLTVNGTEVNCEKYNIDGSNYFKLRDIAYLLRDTTSQFSVDWDAASKTVSITSGQPYAPDGSELVVDGTDKSSSAVKSSQSILVNGGTVSDLSVYNIGGNNYFKLRDLADVLGFGVDYIQETNTATISAPLRPDAQPQQAATPEASGFTPVPIEKLANRKSLQKKATDNQFAQAYAEAVKLVTPFAGLSLEEQLKGIATALRQRFDSDMSYSMESAHYNDPYGYFIEGSASCAGCTRATGLCLSILGIPFEHVNEDKYSHQWCRVNVNGVYWICDAYGLYCGPEPAPYTHPYLQ